MDRRAGLAMAAICSVVAFAAGAQQGPGGESRFPKGIRGLAAGQDGPASANWLLDAKDDAERFRRLQVHAGGTDQQMWQVGYRYGQVHQAIGDRNWELGLYHWRKLRDVLNVALMKRPNRTPNAEALFLDSHWARLEQALQAGDASQAQQAFLAGRGACMACHVAERMAFLNDVPVFRDTAAFRQ